MELLDRAAVSYCLALTKIDKLADGEDAHGAALAEATKHTAAYPEVFATRRSKPKGSQR